MESINLDPIDVPQIPVSEPVVETIPVTGPDNPTVVVPSDPLAVEQQAMRFSIANPSVSEREARDAIFEGRAPQLRQELAVHIDSKRMLETQELIQKAAKYKGSPLTPEQHKFLLDEAIVRQIQGLQTPTDPESVMEKYFAGAYLQSSVFDVAQRLPDGFMTAAIKDHPDIVKEVHNNSNEFMTKQELLRSKILELQEISKNQSWAGYIADTAKDVIPFYFQVKMRRGEGTLDSGLGLGTNVEQQAKDLYRLPLPQFQAQIAKLDALARDNPSLALQFAQNMLSMSDNDVLLYNLITPLEFLGWGGLGKKLIGRAKAAREITQAHADVLKAANGTMHPATGVEAAGDFVEATVQRTMKTIREEIQGVAQPQTKVLESLPTYLRNMAWNYGMNRGGGSRELMNRVEQNMHLFTEKLEELMATVQRVSRIPTVLETREALEAVIKDTKEFYPKKFIANVSTIQHEGFTNTYTVQVTMHRPDGSLFKSEEVARNYARSPLDLGRPDARVVPEGQGYKLVFDHQLRETDKLIRSLIVPAGTVQEQPSVLGTVRAYANRLRTPDDVNIKQDVLNRKVATFAGSELQKLLYDQGNYVRDLSRGVIRNDPVTGEPIRFARLKATTKNLLLGDDLVRDRWKEWESAVKFSNEAQDPSTRKIGYFFQQQGELEAHYNRHFGRMPEPYEVEAYFAMRNLREGGRVAENLGILTKKLRLGAESHVVYTVSADGNKVMSPEFEGVIRKNYIPNNNDTWILMGTEEGMEHVYGRGSPPAPNVRTEITKRIQTGQLKVIEVLDPGARPFAKYLTVGENRVRYVVTPYAESKHLNWEQVPLSGAFREFPYEFTVAQAKIKTEQLGSATFPTHWYEGDKHVAGMMRRAEGANYAKHMNEIQRLIKENKLEEAKAYSNKHMTRDWDEVHKAFTDGTYSLDQKFHVVSRNKKIIDLPKGEFYDQFKRVRYDKDGIEQSTLADGTRTGMLAGQTNIWGDDLTDVLHVRDIGNKHNPVFESSPAQAIDAIPSNDRALTKLTNSLFMDDYKVSSMEHWMRQARPFLKDEDFSLDNAPFFFFHNASMNSFRAEVPHAVRFDLITQRNNIERLIGTPSVLQDGLYRVTQKLFDASYERFGGTAGGKNWITPDWLLPKVQDPFEFGRAIVFHTSMGFYNVAQMALQMNTFVNIFAFAGPKYAAQGTAGMTLHALSAINRTPAIMNSFDNYAMKMGWRKGEWLEAHAELNKTGFKNVQGEHIMRDNQMSPQTVAGANSDFLDAGTFFWRKAEKSVRVGAWYTAFKEWRDANPFAKMTMENRAKILDRADFFAANMSRASASVIHTGALSIPSQFFAYQIRIAEAFWSGARMGAWTSKEGMLNRARAIATYGLVYGAPAATGITGLPLYDTIRSAAIDNGYNPGEKFLSSLFMEGALATSLALISGNQYNVSERYALQGMEVLKEIMRGEKGFLEILGGAAGTKIGGILASLSPIAKFTIGFITGEGVKPSADHILDVFKNVASFNIAHRSLAAINTGKWLSKDGTFLEGQGETGSAISPASAIFMGLSGLAPTGASDIFALSLLQKNQVEFQKKGIKLFTTEWRRMHQANVDNDPENAQQFMKNAYYLLKYHGVPEHKWSSIMSSANRGISTTLREQMDWDRLIVNSPADRRMQDTDTFNRIQQQRNRQ